MCNPNCVQSLNAVPLFDVDSTLLHSSGKEPYDGYVWAHGEKKAVQTKIDIAKGLNADRIRKNWNKFLGS